MPDQAYWLTKTLHNISEALKRGKARHLNAALMLQQPLPVSSISQALLITANLNTVQQNAQPLGIGAIRAQHHKPPQATTPADIPHPAKLLLASLQ